MQPRKLTISDLPQLLQLEERNQVVPWGDDVFKHCLISGYPGWVLVQEGKIIGFVIISVQIGEAHVLNLCVDRTVRKQGFGTQLLVYALEQAQLEEAQIAYLEVRSSNSRAIRLYKSMGFIQIGVRKEYYPVPTGREDALVFAKDLVSNVR